MADEILRTALTPNQECLPVEQLGRYADGALGPEEQTAAEAHIRRCLACQAELALLEAMTSSDVRPEETEVVREGAARLLPRVTDIPGAARPAPSSRRRSFQFGMWPVAAVAALVLVVVATASVYLRVTPGAPRLPSRVAGDEVTRSLAIVVRQPVGEQAESPGRFEWLAVDRAVRYRVRLLEVDRTEVWSTSTSAPAAELPMSVRTSIAPGRTLLWDVTAYDAAGTTISESGQQSFRVVPR